LYFNEILLGAIFTVQVGAVKTKFPAGLAMVETSAVPVSVTLGGKKPLVVLLTSSCAEAAGVAVPIPTCEKAGK